MISAYIPPKRWYLRERQIRVTVWPQWLAQWLCSHTEKSPCVWDQDGSVHTLRCHDCYKWIEVAPAQEPENQPKCSTCGKPYFFPCCTDTTTFAPAQEKK